MQGVMEAGITHIHCFCIRGVMVVICGTDPPWIWAVSLPFSKQAESLKVLMGIVVMRAPALEVPYCILHKVYNSQKYLSSLYLLIWRI